MPAELGHQGIVRMRLWGSELFYGHLMSGASAAVPSYLASPTGGTAPNAAVAQGAGFATIRPFEPVLLDYVFAYNGYLAGPHARLCHRGAARRSDGAAHEAMWHVQSEVKKQAKAGVKAGDIYDLLSHWQRKRDTATILWARGRIAFVLSVTAIGLELDEFPFLAKGQDMRLEQGMIIALEPKLIFPHRGWWVSKTPMLSQPTALNS